MTVQQKAADRNELSRLLRLASQIEHALACDLRESALRFDLEVAAPVVPAVTRTAELLVEEREIDVQIRVQRVST